jgi:hypothetical protein
VLKVEMAKIPTPFSARHEDIFDRIPIIEKSNTPSIRNAFHPSLLSIVFSGTSETGQTNDFSSSVAPVNT